MNLRTFSGLVWLEQSIFYGLFSKRVPMESMTEPSVIFQVEIIDKLRRETLELNCLMSGSGTP